MVTAGLDTHRFGSELISEGLWLARGGQAQWALPGALTFSPLGATEGHWRLSWALGSLWMQQDKHGGTEAR